MRFAVRKTAGKETQSADRRTWFCLALLAAGSISVAQGLYKYRGADGEWKYSDRPPVDDGQAVEVRDLPLGKRGPGVSVTHHIDSAHVTIVAKNESYAPVEIAIALDEVVNVAQPQSGAVLRWQIQPRSGEQLLRLDVTGPAPAVSYRYVWIPGDPTAEHRPARAYRAPFATARQHAISQAYPMAATHTTPDSRYAIDIAMPVGTDIYAARSGKVIEVASSNYRGGFDTSRNGAQANFVRILHADGTFAVYAHLNWNSIRVQPGDDVVRGEYIADSGNTGFSSGPHLHFVVVRNKGMAMESVPVMFEGRTGLAVTPETGIDLTAY